MRIAFVIIIIIIPAALLLLGGLVSKISSLLEIKQSSFECGFEEFSSARLTFSLKFFLIVLVFLVFDVEVALLLPLPIRAGLSAVYWAQSSVLILIILIFGLFLEIKQGRIRWVE